MSLQERLEAARQALSEAKKQNGAFSERLQALKGQQAELELQKEELEGMGRQQEEASRLTPQRCPRFARRKEADLPGRRWRSGWAESLPGRP